MNVLALIPARSGSKSIPDKNIRYIAGKPLVAHSILQALDANLVTRTIVSTDSERYASIARAYGAGVILRPVELSGDDTPSEAALLHALDTLKNAEDYVADVVVFLQATSPYRLPDDIDGAVCKLLDTNADSVFSAYREHFTGRWRVDSTGSVRPINFDLASRPMRQNYPMEYLENGSIYVFRPSLLHHTGLRLGGKVEVFEMPVIRSCQVDDVADLDTIEQLMANQTRCFSSRTFSKVRLLVLDFDGVMTDNTVLVDERASETVTCHRGDGWGIARVREAGVHVVVLSTEKNPVVTARCTKLEIEAIQGQSDKLPALRSLADRMGIRAEEVAYVGNDVNDLECLRWSGVSVAVADSVPAVLAAARYVTSKAGGQGAVREVCDWLLDSHKPKVEANLDSLAKPR